MRTFAEKPNATRQGVSLICDLGQRIDSQAVQRLTDRSRDIVEGGSTAIDIPHFAHDFSQIPVRASVPSTVQIPQTDTGKRDRHAQEAANSIAGKLGAPLPDEGPWVEMSGNSGPETKSQAGVPGSGGAVAAMPPKLSKKTVAGPTARECGGFKWVVQWELDKKTTKGGWVVQRVELPYDVKDCSDKSVDPKKIGGLQPSWYPLWEAWPINKDQRVTTYAEGGDVEDDTYSNSTTSDTKGTTTVKGTAEFYDGLALPSTFKVTNKAPTWILPATNSGPALSGGTGAISHNLKGTWDCCSKGKTATKATKVAPT